MYLRPALLLAALVLSACATTSPPAVEMPETPILPLALDDDFVFRKTLRLVNQPERFEDTENEAINFERTRINFGALSANERRARQGTYFDFFWQSKRLADITVRFEYRQAKLGNAVQAQESVISKARGSIKSSFAVIGDNYRWDGPVTAWRCLLIKNNQIVGFTQSYLWK